jgi:hypothetical protein
MARKTVVELVDDIDGRPADESITFALDGFTYEIDLSTANAGRLREGLAPFVEAARKAGSAPTAARKSPAITGDRERSAEIRVWARQQGLAVNDRGRIPTDVIKSYEAGEPGQAAEPVSTIPQVTFRAVANP